MVFRVLLGLDIAAAAIVVYFFIIGLADGSISSFNIGLWIVLLMGVAAILAGGIFLRKAGRTAASSLLLSLLAVPTAAYGLMIAAIILSGARWN
ncbi:MAG: osmoprotectant transporter permease [Pseudomonadota bacterium]|nr:osmoprotectant transporter permease [Pseudomonadota bacterium]